MVYDAAIVGAGPAGAAAALELASSGTSVILLEGKDLPRYKTCGGGVVGRARRIFGVDIQPVVQREFFSAALHFHAPGLCFEAVRPRPIISMTMRAELDQALALAAEAAGASVRPRTEVRSLCASRGAVHLDTSGGTVVARFVIAADGAHSTVARAAGWSETRRLIPAVEAELHLPDRDFARNAKQARFDFDLVPRGYGWVFPKADHLSVGVLTTARRGVPLPAALARYCRFLGIHRTEKEERHGFVIPLGPRSDGFARGRVLLTGDSAGFADPVTAEGISFAAMSGRLAARALLEGGMEPDRTARAYARAVGAEILPELGAGRFLQHLLYRWPRLRSRLFGLHGRLLVEAVTDVLMGEASYRAAVARPAGYLKLFRSAPPA